MTQFLNRFSRRTRWGVAATALLLTGGVIGGGIARHAGPVPAMAPAAPQPIAQASAASPSLFSPPALSTVRGQVSAVYGSSFTLKDGSGQALVELGRHGRPDDAPLVAVGQVVTVQGMAENGTIRARYLVTADGKAWAVGRGEGHHGHGDRHEGREEREGDDDQGERPAPPPPSQSPPPAPAAAPAKTG
jgi:hypothetical protein